MKASSYLMVAGTFLPATALFLGTSLLVNKKLQFSGWSLLAGGIGLVIGGMYTAKMLKEKGLID